MVLKKPLHLLKVKITPLGTGFSPLLRQANITPMFFSKKNQFLASYQSNNTSEDIAQQLKTLTFEDIIDENHSLENSQNWLNIQPLNTPDFSSKRWLNNQSHLVTGNYLKKLKNDYELGVNISCLNDDHRQNGSSKTLFFTPKNTIALREIQNNKIYTNSLESKATLLVNTQQKYLKNNFNFKTLWEDKYGELHANQKIINQELSSNYFSMNNNFHTKFYIGNQTLKLKSFINYNQTPENLKINPGVFEEKLNDSKKFKHSFQELKLTSFKAEHSVILTKKLIIVLFPSKLNLYLITNN